MRELILLQSPRKSDACYALITVDARKTALLQLVTLRKFIKLSKGRRARGSKGETVEIYTTTYKTYTTTLAHSINVSLVKSVSSESRDTHSRCCRGNFFSSPLRHGVPVRRRVPRTFERSPADEHLWRDQVEKKFNCVPEKLHYRLSGLSIIPGRRNR